MTVPFLDVAAGYRELRVELDAAHQRVMASGSYILGPELTAFEEAFASYVGARHCVGVANGLDALALSLRGMGIGAGDEVIVPTHTYIASWLAITQAGAVPVPVDASPGDFMLDPERTRDAITSRTKAILPVHLYGHPANMPALREIADARGLLLLEDAAQAHGARARGRRVGALGTAAAWSFYPGKNLGAFGDGGAITTDDDGVAANLRALRNYGSARKYVNDMRGWNSRLDEWQAAALRVKLRHLDAWNARRSAIATRYLTELPGTGLALPTVAAEAEPVWHLFVVRSPERERLQRYLAEQGIQTLIHYPIPPHLQRAYGDLGFAAGAFPVAERLADEVLSLPMGPHLADADVERVIAAVHGFHRSGPAHA